MKKYNNWCICFVLFLLLSCSHEDRKIIDERFYNIDFITLNEQPGMDRISASYKGFYNEPTKWEIYEKYMYSFIKEDHNYQNNQIEIEFTRMIVSNDVLRPGFCRIGIINRKAFIICWINKSSIIDKKKSFNTKLASQNECEIGKYTDYIYTNISKDFIEKIYPEFQGFYKKLNIKKIVVDAKYTIDSREFYNHIELDDFHFGIDYRILKDGWERLRI